MASPPVSRPPMALGWPVIENGQAPGLPIRPVARWPLRIAGPLATPCADWLAPMENRLTVRGVSANQSKKGSRSPSARRSLRRLRRRTGRPGAQPAPHLGEAGAWSRDVGAVDGAGADQVGQQAVPQPHVGLRRERQVQVGALAGVGAARIDDHVALAAVLRAPPPCAGTAPDGSRRRCGRRAPRDRPAPGPRSSRAPGRRRRPACGRPPPRPCRAANWCRYCPSR